MCGLIGYFTSQTNGFTYKELEAFKGAMFMNQFRGSHSTGLVSVDNDMVNYTWYRALGGPYKYFDTKDGKDMDRFILQRARFTFGHGRHATRGAQDKLENAHPFEVTIPNTEENIILMHNGTLQSWQPHLKDFHKFDVDSNWLAHQIAELGPEEALAKVKGAMAILWWNTEKRRAYVFRNNDRPLYYLQSKEENELILNSEDANIAWLVLKYKLDQFNISEIKEVPAMELFEIDPLNLKDYTKTTIVPEKDKTVEYSNSRYHPAIWMNNEELGEYNSWRKQNNEQPFFYSDIKSLDKVAEAFALNRITKVVFYPNSIQYYKDGIFISSVQRDSFCQGVSMITRSEDGEQLVLLYAEGDKQEKLFFNCLKKKKEPEKVVNISKATSKWKFTLANSNNKVVSYKARRNNQGRIIELRSSVEGVFKEDMELTVEPYSINTVGSNTTVQKPFLRVCCVLFSRTLTSLVRFTFYTSDWVADEMWNSFYTGKIASIIKLEKSGADGEEFEIVLKNIVKSETAEIPNDIKQEQVH